MRKTYHGSKVLNEKDEYILTLGQNNLDMNVHLYDTSKGIEYLIANEDIHNTEDELDEHGGILESHLRSLSDIQAIKETAWRTYTDQ